MVNYDGNVLICLFGCLSACSFSAYAFTTLLNRGLKGVLEFVATMQKSLLSFQIAAQTTAAQIQTTTSQTQLALLR
ncbi:hypothetical protein Tco_0890219 [Tanacetum coccineum]|uniref:Secreted protein n=1 Tax=Tanacetum coccineum TaxID=301880 RepID=A0ABQ5C2G4_9ASTR